MITYHSVELGGVTCDKATIHNKNYTIVHPLYGMLDGVFSDTVMSCGHSSIVELSRGPPNYKKMVSENRSVDKNIVYNEHNIVKYIVRSETDSTTFDVYLFEGVTLHKYHVKYNYGIRIESNWSVVIRDDVDYTFTNKRIVKYMIEKAFPVISNTTTNLQQ